MVAGTLFQDDAPRPIVRYPGGTADCRHPETLTFNPDVRASSNRKDGLSGGVAFEEEIKEEKPNVDEQPTEGTGMTSGEEEEPGTPRQEDVRSTRRTSRYNSCLVHGGTWLSQTKKLHTLEFWLHIDLNTGNPNGLNKKEEL
ncbi:hypothetical protein NDU88_007449 [Pleurodeles waltl]|uniref:Uncharacterized protein n=1 Tax=Pleurodeles waltl TaxID=8319 RepID=A0AAV7VSL8_PLEWA|nr:hypothetical protein NDU88_007449 [Pleurodeles waltl]